jgi:hypothetical protein
MSAENEIREIVSRYTRAADWRDGEALAKLYDPDAVVEIHYRGPDRMELLGTPLRRSADRSGHVHGHGAAPAPGLEPPHHLRPPSLRQLATRSAPIPSSSPSTSSEPGSRGRVARRHLRRPGHHQARRVRVLPLRFPPDRRSMAHPPPGHHTRHPVRLLIARRPVPDAHSAGCGEELRNVRAWGRLDGVAARPIPSAAATSP